MNASRRQRSRSESPSTSPRSARLRLKRTSSSVDPSSSDIPAGVQLSRDHCAAVAAPRLTTGSVIQFLTRRNHNVLSFFLVFKLAHSMAPSSGRGSSGRSVSSSSGWASLSSSVISSRSSSRLISGKSSSAGSPSVPATDAVSAGTRALGSRTKRGGFR